MFAIFSFSFGKKKEVPSTTTLHLSAKEVVCEKHFQQTSYWVKITQHAHILSKLKTLTGRNKLGEAHSLDRLTTYIDSQGIIRVGRRLKFTSLPKDSEHRAILPRESIFIKLILRQAHLRTLYAGTQLTLGTIRLTHWIIGDRAPVRLYIPKCVVCAWNQGIRAQQLISKLPIARLTPAWAFLNSGLDYADPIYLESRKGRGHKLYKG